MKRRKFLKSALPLGLTPVMLNGIPIKTFATGLMATNFTCEEVADRAMVIVQLHGANDGINTVIPVDQYSLYANLRPNIRIQDTGANAYIPLDNTLAVADQVGLHPRMTGMKALYDDGLLNVVQGVNYANNNKSHFQSSNIWMTGGDSTAQGQNKKTGWMGRYLDTAFPNYPADYPNAIMQDPIGLEFGSKTVSLGYHRQVGVPIGLTLSNDPTDFYNMVSGIGGVAPSIVPSNRYGAEMQYLMDVQQSSDSYGLRLNTCYNSGSNTASYPLNDVDGTGWNELSPQLETVARLINGGCKTKIFLVRLGGFDTHTNQVDGTNTASGYHAQRLYFLSTALKAFHDDLVGLGIADKVMTVTFSEFGRQVGENSNLGTDHGTLAPMMVMGRGVTPGVTGTNPDYANLNGNDFSSFQYDYRQIFTTMLQDWLGANDNSLTYTEFDPFISQKLDLVNANYVDALGATVDFKADPSCDAASFPVSLTYFDAELDELQRVELRWGTSSELNNDYFEIERSADGRVFQPLERISGAGNSTSELTYKTFDEEPLPGVSYYRLKQVDLDGSFSYEGIVSVRIEIQDEVVAKAFAYPNPASDELHIQISSSEELPVLIRMFSLNGQLVKQESVRIRKGLNTFTWQVTELNTGLYFCELVAKVNNRYDYKRLSHWKQQITN